MAKREPGKLNVGTPPPGTGGYLAAELFKAAAGIDFAVVTYKGTGPLTNDLLGGHVPVAFNVLAPAMGNLQAGTPAEIVERLNRELRTALNDPEVKARILADGGDPLPSTPREYAADIEKEEPKWSALIRRLGLRVE